MKIRIYSEIIECAAVIKRADSIILLDASGAVIREDSGITNFSGYEMVEGEWTDESSVPTRLDAMEAQMTYTAMMTDTLLEV